MPAPKPDTRKLGMSSLSGSVSLLSKLPVAFTTGLAEAAVAVATSCVGTGGGLPAVMSSLIPAKGLLKLAKALPAKSVTPVGFKIRMPCASSVLVTS